MNPATILRWIRVGILMPAGDVLRLQAVQVGSRWFTTDKWLDEFIAARTAASIAPNTEQDS